VEHPKRRERVVDAIDLLALQGDPMAGPVLNTATALLSALVAFQGEGH